MLGPWLPRWRRHIVFLLVAACWNGVSAEYINKFDICKQRVLSVLNGTESYGDITNETIRSLGLLYTGLARELESGYPRSQYTLLTYKGCIQLCGKGTDIAQLAEPTFALNMVTTWIFPLAIVLSLPYESLHNLKFRRTSAAILNWLGSPQTALTATIFNFRQIREAHRRALVEINNKFKTWNDMYYVLSCLNQFDIPYSSEEGIAFFQVLVYGLFGPVLGRRKAKDTKLTKYLLRATAHQLRMHRRRSVMPTLASLGIFLVAFVFSVVLSFAQVGENTKVDLLVLGLLFTWLPVLVIFTIVDRNPVSSERTAELMSRWLFNVNAVREWKATGSRDVKDVRWWGQSDISDDQDEDEEPPDGEEADGQENVHDADSDPTKHTQDAQEGKASQSGTRIEIGDDRFELGQFIGQGRKMQFCGVSWALMKELDILRPQFKTLPDPYAECARRLHRRLSKRPPSSWYLTALSGLFIVWMSISMALLLAYNTPTIGVGCWSGSFLLYGTLSTFSWFAQFADARNRTVRGICNTFNLLSFSWLIAITFLMVTGATNTCWCNSLHFFPSFGDYTNLENATFYREHCKVVKFWAVATAFGLGMPICVFLVAVFWWLRCQHLWKANEKESDVKLRTSGIDWVWLT